MNSAERTVLTVILAIVAHRLCFFALSLIGITFFLLFVHLRARLKRPRKQPQLWEQELDSATQTTLSFLTNHTGQMSSQGEQHPPSRPLSVQNSQSSYIETGSFTPGQALIPNRFQNHLPVPSTATESPTLSYRSESIVSQPFPTVTRPLSGRQGSQHRRSSWRGSTLSDINVDERHAGADMNSEYYLHSNGAQSLSTAGSSSTLPLSNPNPEVPRPNVGISDIEFPLTPTSIMTVPDEEMLVETPRTRRFPARGSMYTEQSIMTLPLYRENGDERLSIASRAPTYISTLLPRESMPPLPVPPSAYLPTVVPDVT